MSLANVDNPLSTFENTKLQVKTAVDEANAFVKAAALLATFPVGSTYWT